ncbi:competence protein TfoX, partial [bacterium]|nr:competence protein TfoX [bacterium]
NKLFVKPTEGGRKFIGKVVEAPAYAGSKLFFFIEEQFENKEWLSELIRVTEKELPAPKPKKQKPHSK